MGCGRGGRVYRDETHQQAELTKYQSDKLTRSLVMFEAGYCEQLERSRPNCLYNCRIIDRSRKTPGWLACVPESDQLPSPCNCRPFLLWSTSFFQSLHRLPCRFQIVQVDWLNLIVSSMTRGLR